MTLGIVLAVFLLILLGNHFLKKTPIKKYAMKIHKIIGCIFIALTILHMVLTLPLIKQRPIAMYLLGFLMIALAVASLLLYIFRRKNKKWLYAHKILAYCLLVCMILHAYLGFSSLQAYQQNIASIHVENIDLSQINDGTYIGDYDAGYIYAKVEVTVIDHSISSITLIEHRNEHGKKAETIVNDIVEQQEITVDTISSATNSSKVIEQAVYNALKED